ncbi:MAG: F0F1 ATP synthase subunit epsilon [Thermodesulfobacteriota bacterium]|nr:F0F1 ATP synthase subunit epsilon [Thermodesulfobacteriota bacterium]
MAEEYMQLDVVTPEKAVLSRKVGEVVAPGSIGEFGVMPGHTPFLTSLKAGRVLARTMDRDIHLAVGGGFAEITGDRVIILAETAQMAEDIDVDQAQKDLEIAQNKLSTLDKDGPEFKKWTDRLTRAEVSIKVAQEVES